MVMCDYFSAPDDAAAVAVLDLPGGLGAPRTDGGPPLDVQPLKGIDPVVVLARLESILTDAPYDEVSERPRVGQLLSSPAAEGAFVLSVSDTLQTALVTATPAALTAAAGPWSRTEELEQCGLTAETCAHILELLADLASRASASGLRLYCRWAL
ncbi:hypothetical protein [Streptomyces sp. Da 82-17]|uniref:hypothetical protein n=1 Tax=Streptomyces sp. Da 82-17 TaxID=3377116 RepID=UPI0038D4D9F7